MATSMYQDVSGYEDENSTIASPAAQTFTSYTDVFLKSVDLYFTTNDENDNYGITMEIRNVKNNVPGDIYYGRSAVSNVNADPNGNKKTTFTFDTPILLHKNQQYAILLFTQSTNYQLAVSEYAHIKTSSNTAQTANIDNQNPNGYVGGSFCYSMDGKHWSTGNPNVSKTPGGAMCLKFTLNRCDFNTTAVIPMDVPNNLKQYPYPNNAGTMNNISYLTMNPKWLQPAATNVQWLYNYNDDLSTAKPFKPNYSYPIQNGDINQVYVWAELSGTNLLSPMIDPSSLALDAQLSYTDQDRSNTDIDKGMVLNNEDVVNSFNPSNVGTSGAGTYVSRNIQFTDTGNKDTTFNEIYASYECLDDGIPDPVDIYFNLNADSNPSNPFNNMWILMPGYDEYYMNGNNRSYYTVNPYDSQQVLDEWGHEKDISSDSDYSLNRSYSEKATGGIGGNAWYRYHFHVSLPRLTNIGYYPYTKNSNGNVKGPTQYNGILKNGKTGNLDIKGNEIKYKIVIHTSNYQNHPKVRKFLTTVNRSDEDEAETD